MTGMTDRQSRALALGILAIVVLGAILIVAVPVSRAWTAKVDSVEELQFQVARLEALAARQDELAARLQQARQRNPSIGYYVAGNSPALASANLQRHIKLVVDRNGGELVSTQIGKQADDGTSVDLDVHIKCDMQKCFPILFALESGKPMLFVDRLTITSRQLPARRPDQVASVELDMRFSARGYRLEQST